MLRYVEFWLADDRVLKQKRWPDSARPAAKSNTNQDTERCCDDH